MYPTSSFCMKGTRSEGISWDVKGHLRPGTFGIDLCGASQDILGDVKGHLRPGTLGIVLGGTSQDILGYPRM